MHQNKPIAFYSRKLNSAQKRYTTGEQQLLSIVETLKEFRNILIGHNTRITKTSCTRNCHPTELSNGDYYLKSMTENTYT